MKKNENSNDDDLTRGPFKRRANGDYMDRRRLEMKRRFGVLQTRRSYLERELAAIKMSLHSLDKQIKNSIHIKQLSSQRKKQSTL